MQKKSTHFITFLEVLCKNEPEKVILAAIIIPHLTLFLTIGSYILAYFQSVSNTCDENKNKNYHSLHME